jgi:hypothetical protein
MQKYGYFCCAITQSCFTKTAGIVHEGKIDYHTNNRVYAKVLRCNKSNSSYISRFGISLWETNDPSESTALERGPCLMFIFAAVKICLACIE